MSSPSLIVNVNADTDRDVIHFGPGKDVELESGFWPAEAAPPGCYKQAGRVFYFGAVEFDPQHWGPVIVQPPEAFLPSELDGTTGDNAWIAASGPWPGGNLLPVGINVGPDGIGAYDFAVIPAPDLTDFTRTVQVFLGSVNYSARD